jgi:PhoH-like ATPase
MSTIRNYCLDTNVLLSDPQSIFKFEEHNVLIPLKVLEELDNFKSEMSERGRASRTTARLLDKFRDQGNLFDGITIERPDESIGGKLSVITAQKQDLDLLPPALDKSKADNIILAAVLSLPQTQENILVTLDVGLRLRCDSLHIKSEPYRGVKSNSISDSYSGCKTIEIPTLDIDSFYMDKEYITEEPLLPNQYVLMKAINNGKSAIGKFDPISQKIVHLYRNTDFRKNEPNIWGIGGRNVGQRFALDALLDDNLMLVTLTGKAGSGKTLLALAAGLYLTADCSQYSRVLAARPVFPMGKDLGFLPGDLEEKLAPWMQPIYDNADLLLNAAEDEDGRKRRGHEELTEMGILEIEALTYVRGRSIPRQYMIIDESQNLTIHEIKTIITRAGEGTKIVLTGDPDQIDNPLLDKTNNGLIYVIEKFKDKNIAAHITLEKGERSELATLAAEIL